MQHHFLTRHFISLLMSFFFGILSATSQAQESSLGLRMTIDDLEITISSIDENYQREDSYIRFHVSDIEVTVVADANADRMRIMIPVIPAEAMDEELLVRVMQANFDSALDARYAIGQGILWSTFIHPLSSLTENDFLSAIGQTINTATSFGTSFSSGALVYGGGDSNTLNEQRKLIDDLLKKGQRSL